MLQKSFFFTYVEVCFLLPKNESNLDNKNHHDVNNTDSFLTARKCHHRYPLDLVTRPSDLA